MRPFDKFSTTVGQNTKGEKTQREIKSFRSSLAFTSSQSESHLYIRVEEA